MNRLIITFFLVIVALFGCKKDPEPAKSALKDLLTFSFQSSANPSLAANVEGIISGRNIAVSVPFGTKIDALKATFTTSPLSNTTVSGVKQESGITANNFSSPVTYRVTAEDGSTAEYVVTVTVAKSSEKVLLLFSFKKADNPALSMDVEAMVMNNQVMITLPPRTDITALKATFVASAAASVTVGTAAQVSGQTANDFSRPVVYRITAADGSTADYTITVSVAKSGDKTITAFGFQKSDNPDLPADLMATISGTQITATLPVGVRPNALKATFMTSPLATVTIAGKAQASGLTVNDFGTALVYKVTAEDGTSTDYTVTIQSTLSTDRTLSSFGFLKADNPALAADILATISGVQITVSFPGGTNPDVLKNLKPAFKSGNFTTVTVGNVPQVSSTTPNDFSKPVVYRVTSQDNNSTDYTVMATIIKSADKQLLSFSFLKVNNPTLSEDVALEVSPNRASYLVTLPTGINLSALKPTFAVSPRATIIVNNSPQTSGQTPQDFSKGAVAYRITAENGTNSDFTIELSVQINLATVDDAVQAFMTKYSVPGMSVAIAKDERLVYAKGYGLSNKEQGTFVTPNTQFRVASVSKYVTAIAAMKLVEEGKLNLDQKVFGVGGILGTTYGTQPYAANIEKITVRQLLDHTAGGDAWTSAWDLSKNRIDPFYQKEWLGYTQAQVISATLDNRPPTQTPGAKFVYSNVGINIAGRVIEKVTGIKYEKYVQDFILKTANISPAAMRIGGTTLAERFTNEVVYYHPYPGYDQPYDFPVPRFDAHGGWVTTAVDLAKLLVHTDGFTNKKDILSAKSVKEMLTPSKVSLDQLGGNIGYGLGCYVNPAGNLSTHRGGMAGMAAVWWRLNGYSWVLLINTQPNNAVFLGELDALMNAYLGNTAGTMKGDQFDVFYK